MLFVAETIGLYIIREWVVLDKYHYYNILENKWRMMTLDEWMIIKAGFD